MCRFLQKIRRCKFANTENSNFLGIGVWSGTRKSESNKKFRPTMLDDALLFHNESLQIVPGNGSQNDIDIAS